MTQRSGCLQADCIVLVGLPKLDAMMMLAALGYSVRLAPWVGKEGGRRSALPVPRVSHACVARLISRGLVHGILGMHMHRRSLGAQRGPFNFSSEAAKQRRRAVSTRPVALSRCESPAFSRPEDSHPGRRPSVYLSAVHCVYLLKSIRSRARLRRTRELGPVAGQRGGGAVRGSLSGAEGRVCGLSARKSPRGAR